MQKPDVFGAPWDIALSKFIPNRKRSNHVVHKAPHDHQARNVICLCAVSFPKRAHNATPILITPVRRFVFGADNRLSEGASALLPYAVAVRNVGCESNVAVVDLFASSTRYFEEIGPAACDELSPVPGEDFTHFNPIGARAVAVLVEQELRPIILALK